LAFSKKAIKHFDKKGCNWKSAPDEIWFLYVSLLSESTNTEKWIS
jgi:hypothetical protein